MSLHPYLPKESFRWINAGVLDETGKTVWGDKPTQCRISFHRAISPKLLMHWWEERKTPRF